MTRSVHICVAILLDAALVAGTSAVATAQDTTSPANELNASYVLKEKKVRLSGGDNNVVRSGPGNGFAIVGIYPDGDEFLVIAKRDEWYNIRLSDTNTGWIHSSLCEEFDDMSAPLVSPRTPVVTRSTANPTHSLLADASATTSSSSSSWRAHSPGHTSSGRPRSWSRSSTSRSRKKIFTCSFTQ